MNLTDLKKEALVSGLRPGGPVRIIDVRWHGSDVVEVVFRDAAGNVDQQLLFRDDEPRLSLEASGRSWAFDADGEMFRLVSEAYRIRLAHLFDPYLAVHTSLVEPLPHQITAVYGEMLSRQPLRYLLADDPGAGKTIMAGLLIKELAARGDLTRCLIVCPGNLVDQWQDELSSRFHLSFQILTRDHFESSLSGNPFLEMDLMIARLDQLSRNDAIQAKLSQTHWDLVVCDEAHKMSASFFGGDVKETKRYKLGRLLSSITRHFLLMTATPHNGKEEDFQLFLALLDGDRFEGRFRDGVHVVDTSDIMRRMVKENLYRFDGTRLFPERCAYTVTYKLSDLEADLYERVTQYVREEFNRADALEDGKRKGTVGFALTILQRRLASSPEAIFQSLRRRRERLEQRLREEEVCQRGQMVRLTMGADVPAVTEEDLDDLDDAPSAELEALEEAIVDQATAARTIEELKAEIAILSELEKLAQRVRLSGRDKKWEELSDLLQENPHMFDSKGLRRKLILFTEHRDTLNYLKRRIRTLLGRPEAVVVIHGGMGREERKKAETAFLHDPEVQILVATDAAGEGVNLQRAHLMVNYDLPWNPNRIEQRFGRIHRIGQTEVCHLWNLVAEETREGDVYLTLLRKLEVEREALGGAVFDVLGKAVSGKALRELLIEAIRYGERSDVRERLTQKVETALDRKHLQELLEERSLARDVMDTSRVMEIRREMERAQARRLQPHFIETFFLEAFRRLGGTIVEREPRRYEIRHVPAFVRRRDHRIGRGETVLPRYERICFEKEKVHVPGKPLAAFVCPGHPLLDAVIDLILERDRHLLKKGAFFVDESDAGDDLRTLFYLEHAVKDGRKDATGARRIISQRFQFVEADATGRFRRAGMAPYLDYRPLTDEERSVLEGHVETRNWLKRDLESQAVSYAVRTMVPEHFREVQARTEERVHKTAAAVKERLTKEITYWDHRAEELRLQEAAGKVNARINSAKARNIADELAQRLQRRLAELEEERNISALPPVVVGGALIVPRGLLDRLQGKPRPEPDLDGDLRVLVERIAMEAVLARERALGFEPRDVSDLKVGYDVESAVPGTGKLRFIEVKGRVEGSETITVTKNEILTALNKPEDYFLAVVLVSRDRLHQTAASGSLADVPVAQEGQTPLKPTSEGLRLHYLANPFQREPDFAATSVTYDLKQLIG
ncbi:MAG: helicase-related protein [Thermodesulfobacteriota bacterium]|nr:helicase-related protein [Thermodesulfobacteriota bacterium]